VEGRRGKRSQRGREKKRKRESKGESERESERREGRALIYEYRQWLD
jgi:hypothetical protein